MDKEKNIDTEKILEALKGKIEKGDTEAIQTMIDLTHQAKEKKLREELFGV